MTNISRHLQTKSITADSTSSNPTHSRLPAPTPGTRAVCVSQLVMFLRAHTMSMGFSIMLTERFSRFHRTTTTLKYHLCRPPSATERRPDGSLFPECLWRLRSTARTGLFKLDIATSVASFYARVPCGDARGGLRSFNGIRGIAVAHAGYNGYSTLQTTKRTRNARTAMG